MKTKAIGFDYGGVIGGIGNNFTESICGVLNIPKEEYREIYFSHNYLINTGKVSTWKEFWPIVLDKLGKRNKLDEVLKISNSVTYSYTDFDQLILSYISDLRSRGYKTGLLSNATKEVGRILRLEGLDKYFDSFFISAEIGLQKPDPQTFELLATSLEVSINNLIFIDDAEKSLSTADICGYTPVLFKSFEQMKEEVEKLLA
ncbi:HAD-IA family hydrolase [Patescibacteria group bacterium]|nr:HAD-IA family hydrolase [Patescibacteria group bacterium]MBU1967002.1 HAD-IA family hydrolase [Patescibacteria group bacterium]MBU2543335.1 HAD-IA family hydrolase [Patescibacteria group bacterium]